jgi:hypothetical protein
MRGVLFGLAVAGLTTLASGVGAQPAAGGTSLDVETIPSRVLGEPERGRRVFSAKFICGTPADPEAAAELAPGRYLTAVNIRNPNATPVTLTKGVVGTWPERTGRREPLRQRPDEILGPEEGLEVDCRDIRRLLDVAEEREPFVKGFVVIKTPGDDLDVVGVYTATNAGAP